MIIRMAGLLWVMEWTSVLVIILRIPKKKKKQTNKIQEDKEGEPRNKRLQSKLFEIHCTNRSENKLTIHHLDFYRHFLLNHDVRACI